MWRKSIGGLSDCVGQPAVSLYCIVLYCIVGRPAGNTHAVALLGHHHHHHHHQHCHHEHHSHDYDYHQRNCHNHQKSAEFTQLSLSSAFIQIIIIIVIFVAVCWIFINNGDVVSQMLILMLTMWFLSTTVISINRRTNSVMQLFWWVADRLHDGKDRLHEQIHDTITIANTNTVAKTNAWTNSRAVGEVETGYKAGLTGYMSSRDAIRK